MTITDADTAHTIRAAAHMELLSTLRPAQHFQDGVREGGVTVVMLALENGAQPLWLRKGWVFPRGTDLCGLEWQVSTIIREMIRTGLVRHVIDRWASTMKDDILVPALVHYRLDGRSACLFAGEDLGPMRARLVDRLDLVDCLQCESVVATGHIRKL